MAPRRKRKKPAKSSRQRTGKPSSPNLREAGQWFEKLVALQARLRAPGGCPWDREQTHKSLRTYLIEEAYEVLDALDGADDGKISEELGDLLLQVTFHAEIARQEGRFDISDVIRAIHEKMVRRHPHVFGVRRVRSAEEVLKNWDAIKAEERSERRGTGNESEEREEPSLLDTVPRSLPAAMEGYQLTRKASKIGFDWADIEGIFDKIQEECSEVRAVVKAKNGGKVAEELGDLLFAAVNLARFLKVDPEIALKDANRKFARRFRSMERLARESGRALAAVPRAEMEALWEQVKFTERELNKA